MTDASSEPATPAKDHGRAGRDLPAAIAVGVTLAATVVGWQGVDKFPHSVGRGLTHHRPER